MFEFKYVISENDYIEFNKRHLLNSRLGKGLILFCRLLFPLIFACVILVSWLNHADEVFLYLLAAAGIAGTVVFFFVGKPLYLRNYTKILRRSFATGNNGKPPFNNECLLRFEKDCIFEITSTGESKASYSVIEKITEGKEAVYLYLNAARALILPFRVFLNENQKNEFLAFVKQQTDKTDRT